MSSLVGVRVVRGKDWKWGDQDGGEGFAGTVIDTNSGSSTRPVTVIWDSGFKGHYRAGPKGCYDLRIVDDPSGENHDNIVCGNEDCRTKVIRGMRWKCVDCEVDLCTVCFLNETPNHKDHYKFQRYDNAQVIDPRPVTSWNEDGPENKIKLMGIFTGAEVVKRSIRASDSEDDIETGVVSSDLTDKSGKILVQWNSTGEQSREERCSRPQLMFGAVIGGYYYPECLPSAKIKISETTSTFTRSSSLREEINEWTKKGSDLFLKAVEEGDLEIAKFLYTKDREVIYACYENGRTTLHVGCIKGHKEIVKWLVEVAQMVIEKPDDSGYRAIHHAVEQCELGVLEFLIQHGALLDVLSADGTSALHIAVYNRFTECVQLLIRSGCEVNIKDFDGIILLHSIISSRTTPEPIIQAVCSSRRINWTLKDSEGYNALQLAVMKNDLKVVELILEHMDQDCVLEGLPRTLDTVLHYACIRRNFKVAELLLRHLMAEEETPSVSSRLVKLLESKTTSGLTALLIAVSKKDCPLIELLLEAGADMNVTDENGDTALIQSAKDPSSTDWIPPNDWLSPTIVKAFEKFPSLYFIAYLIEKGFLWNTANSSGQKPAELLLVEYPEEAIEILNRFSSKIQISKRRSSGGTACMGRDGCIQPPEFQLTCPHNPPYKGCAHCFANCIDGARCGCADESTSIFGIPRNWVGLADIKQEVIEIEEDDDTPSPNNQRISDDDRAGCSRGSSNLGRDHQGGCGAHIAAEEDMKMFALEFRRRRENIGYTQKAVADKLRALGINECDGNIINQNAISRFEALGTRNTLRFSFKIMEQLKPILLKWLEEAEAAQGTKRKNIEVSGNNINKQPKPS